MKKRFNVQYVLICLAVWFGSGYIAALRLTPSIAQLTPRLHLEDEFTEEGDNQWFKVDSIDGRYGMKWYGVVRQNDGSTVINQDYTKVELISIDDGHTLAVCYVWEDEAEKMNLTHILLDAKGNELLRSEHCIDENDRLTVMGFINHHVVYASQDIDGEKRKEELYFFDGTPLSSLQRFYLYYKFYIIDVVIGFLVMIGFILFNRYNKKRDREEHETPNYT